jgi:hypothetical protein
METLTAEPEEPRARLDAAAAAHQAERTQLDERHVANEARWLVEIDRGRLGAKEAAKDYERQLKELRVQIADLQGERMESKQQLQDLRAELRTSMTGRSGETACIAAECVPQKSANSTRCANACSVTRKTTIFSSDVSVAARTVSALSPEVLCAHAAVIPTAAVNRAAVMPAALFSFGVVYWADRRHVIIIGACLTSRRPPGDWTGPRSPPRIAIRLAQQSSSAAGRE